MRAIVAGMLVLTLATPVEAANVDWKYFGLAFETDQSVCFYDAIGTISKSSELMRVWTKCLLRKDIDSIDPNSELGVRITKGAVQKVVDGYIPPIAIVEDMDFDQALEVIGIEETANIGNIQPYAEVLFELNCSERMMITLSVHLGGKELHDQRQGSGYVMPESNGARLLTMLCPKQ